MDAVDQYRAIIARVFRDWEALPRMPSDWFIEGVEDHERDRYVLLHVDTNDGRHKSRTLAHLEIRDGKIRVLADNTNGRVRRRVKKAEALAPAVSVAGDLKAATRRRTPLPRAPALPSP